MIIRDRWRPPRSHKGFVITGKQPTFGSDEKDYAYWVLAGGIEDEFGNEPASILEIYRKVTGPLGLSSYQTEDLVKSAKLKGYLK